MLDTLTFPYYPLVLDAATGVIGTLLIWSGLTGLFINPPALARFFGLPKVTEQEVVFVPTMSGRNLGVGIFIWILTILGERFVLGIFLLCWTWAGIADTKILYDHPRGESQGMHIRNIFILLVLGPLLIKASAG